MKRTHAVTAAAVAAVIGAASLAVATAQAHDQKGGWRDGDGHAMMDRPAMMERMEMMIKRRGMMGERSGCGGAGMAKLATPLTVKDVTAQLEKRLEWRGNKRLKVGKVEMTKDKTIVAEIVTVDGSLVRKIEIDPSTGMRHPIN